MGTQNVRSRVRSVALTIVANLCLVELLSIVRDDSGTRFLSRAVVLLLLLVGSLFMVGFFALRKRLGANAALLAARKCAPQFSLADLLAVPLFVALVLTVHKAIWPNSLMGWCMPITFLLALYLLWCQLQAGRRGCTRYGLKFAYGAGIFLARLGWVGLFVLIVFIECALINPDGIFARLIRTLLFVDDAIGERGPLVPFRLVLIGFPIGLAINQFVEQQLLEK